MASVSVFDNKAYNPQAFGAYIESLPKDRENALIKANIFRSSSDVRSMFANQSTTAYGVIPMYGNFEGEAQNYDGTTDLTGTNLDTYYYGVHSYGRAIVGTEKDYTKDLIAGIDPLTQIASKFAERWDDINEDTLLNIITGIFASTTTGGAEFAEAHTTTLTTALTGTSIYDATQKACGDKNKNFSLVIMNSYNATILAKEQLLEYVKYTDARGLQTNTNIAQWGDKIVLVDDEYTYDSISAEYTTYVLGAGAFIKELMPVEQAFETHREPLVSGGQTNIISRERLVVHPYGFSFTNSNVSTTSPTDDEFADGSNWDLMTNSDGSKYFNHKFIPIAKIVSVA